VLTLSGNEKDFAFSVELANRSEGISVLYALAAQTDTDPAFTQRDVSNAVDFNDFEAVLSRDIFVILGNVTQLFSAIEEAGYDISFLTDLIFGSLF
jgi:hypothetical protein